MSDKMNILITGATTGIGKATAVALARQGHHIITHGRNDERTAKALEEIPREAGNGKVTAFNCDLSSLTEVRAFAEQVKATVPHLDRLINNAGLMTRERKESQDGFELMLGVNHLSHFLLTNLLLDHVKAAPEARIITVSSAVHTQGKINFDDLQLEQKFSMWSGYGNSKLMNILFTRELARRLEGTPITANALHPGVINSDFGRNLPKWMGVVFSWFAKSTEDGAKTTLHLATQPEGGEISGEYFDKQKVAKSSPESKDMALAAKLWDWSEKAVGLS